MCLAIYKPEGKTIPKRYLKNAFHNNDDGAGFAYAVNGKVTIQKGFFTFAEFYRAYKKHVNETAIIHFRMATHGLTDEANCHPFELCDGKFALIHNGILDIQCHDSTRSDTAHFASLVLEPLLKGKIAFNDPALRYLVESAIGTMNKIVVLRADGKFVIYNEKAGHWNNDIWYSNDSYKSRAFTFGDSWRDWTSNVGYSYAAYSSTGTGKYSRAMSRDDAAINKAKFPDWNAKAYGITDDAWNDAAGSITIEEMERDAMRERAAKFSERRERLMLTQAEADVIENQKYAG